MRALVRFALLLFAVTISACGASQKCSPSNCNGCCSADGTCESGSASNACGVGGTTCSSCLFPQACMGGFCSGGTTGGGSGGGSGTTGGGSGGGSSTCQPRSCIELGKNCGEVDDGCGGAVMCGNCEVPGESCGGNGQPNVCGGGACTPRTCEQLGKNCGSVSDGCSALLDCGACMSPDTCGGGGTANVCGQGCTPTTCAMLGKNCGTVSDGCGGTLQCGSCSGAQTCGGGGTANVCGAGCVAKTCAQLGKNCGLVADGCGGFVECGTCANLQTCGGAGVDNVCGATCSSCPMGYTCNASGVCAGGNAANLVLDVPVPPLHVVSGKVTINGMDAVATLCSSSTRARISFEHTTDTRFSSTTDVQGCTNLNDPYAFTTQLYPGTYKVTVTRGGSGGSTLPNWATVSSTNFVVSAPQSNVVFDVPVPPLHVVSGKVTINGMDAVATLCSSSTRARITFDHTTDTRFSTATDVQGCTNLNDPYTFTTQLYPGTYKVTVTRGGSGGSTLPNWATVSSTAFVVNAPQSNVVFDVPIPPLHTVSGRVTLNGMDAVATLCSSSTRARITFEHTTDTRFSGATDVQGCTNLNDPYTFTTQLYPGTYTVTVTRGGSSGSTLPNWATVSATAFVVNAPQANVVFDVPVPPLHVVSGKVTINGMDAVATLCSSSTRARITFDHTTDTRFSSMTDVQGCTNLNDPYAFTTQLYPGTYKVTVTRGGSSGSTLPSWATVSATAFVVNAAQSNAVFDVPIPPLHTVSGKVTINGMDAVATLCSSSTRARITFDHTDTRFSSMTDVQGCTNLNDPYTFTTQLYPGTYKVTVTRGGSGGSTLPNWATVSSMSFTVNAPQANVVFDVPVPQTHTVSGRITINGVDAVATLCSSSTRARITFEHLTDTRFSSATDVQGCTNLNDPYTFTTQLYPGVYKVTVTRGGSGGSTLPTWATVAVARLQVP